MTILQQINQQSKSYETFITKYNLAFTLFGIFSKKTALNDTTQNENLIFILSGFLFLFQTKKRYEN